MKKVVQVVVGLLVFAGAGLVLGRNWSVIGDAFKTIGAGRLALAALALVGQHLAVACAWILLVRRFGAVTRVAPFVRAYGLALLPKYVPGRVAAQGVRWLTAREAGLEPPAIAASLVWETLIALAAAGVVGSLTLGEAGGPVRTLAIALTVAVALSTIALTLIARRWPTLVAGRWAAWAGATSVTERPAALLPSLIASAVGWVGAGAALSLLAAPFGSLDLLTATGWSALGWVAGYLSLVAPAGLVVREGVIVWGLTAAFGAGPALAIAAWSRIAGILTDLLLSALVLRLPSR